jgi:hypothetical protein
MVVDSLSPEQRGEDQIAGPVDVAVPGGMHGAKEEIPAHLPGHWVLPSGDRVYQKKVPPREYD